MLWRTSGSVLGLHGIVVGAAVDLANSGGIVGMVALWTTRRCVAAPGTVSRGWRGNRGRYETWGFAALTIAVRVRFLRWDSLLLRLRFGCGLQGWLRVHRSLRGGVNGVGVGDLAWDLIRGLGRRRLSFG